MLAFQVRCGISAEAVERRLKLIRPAVSLGGVESTICSPVQTSHAKLPATERQRLGITESLLRLSVGVEHYDDLAEDLAQALSEAGAQEHQPTIRMPR